MDNVGGGVGFTNINALPLGKILQSSYGRRREGSDKIKIKNKGMVKKMMSNMPKKSHTFSNMTGSK